MDDGTTLIVYTNKCAGLNSHLKHKIKRIRGSNTHYVAGYITEACWRMNIRALKKDHIENFFDMIAPLSVYESKKLEDDKGDEVRDTDESIDVRFEHDV